ncbi:hypothetical protein ASF92_03525 [Pedobacter sp. Leaf176]|nr:hypothetical protein ASF92_03525 [Pedobacter sp. Leaf176]
MFIAFGAFASSSITKKAIKGSRLTEFSSITSHQAVKNVSMAKTGTNQMDIGGCTVKIHCEFVVKVNAPGVMNFNLLVKNDLSFTADNCIEAGKAAGAFAAQLIKELA